MLIAVRFWKKVKKTKTCWLWTGYKHSMGYGQFRLNNKNISAHRLSWILNRGPIPKGMYVCHTCDNPSCIRPLHLFLGTPLDNKTDSVKKNRHYKLGRPKILTNNQIKEIRQKYIPYKYSTHRLAKEYKVTAMTILHHIKCSQELNPLKKF